MSHSLLEQQRGFKQAVFDGEETTLNGWVSAGGRPAPLGISIYANNLLVSRCNVLAEDYPVVNRLVGCDFFAQMARAFVRATPSCSGDLGEFGNAFPTFVEAYQPAASLPYLGDVARLEQAWNEAFLAAEAPSGNMSALVALSPARVAKLRMEMHPALRMLSSRFPIKDIWLTNQAGFQGDGRLDLDHGGDFLILVRRADTVEIHAMSRAEHVWLMAIRSGETLGQATETALELDESFDLGSVLQRQLALANIINFYEET